MQQKDDKYNYMYKIVLLGDQGVGKTHLLNKYVKEKVPKNLAPTIGVEFANTTCNLNNGGQVKVQIWDTAGQEKYRSITSAHYRRAVGALLVYDITKEKSFDNIQKWMEEIKINCDPDIVLMLIGNKLDLVEKQPTLRKVKQQTAQQFAEQNSDEENKILFQETSAQYSNSNTIKDVFQKLIEEIYDRQNKLQQQNTQYGDESVIMGDSVNARLNIKKLNTDNNINKNTDSNNIQKNNTDNTCNCN